MRISSCSKVVDEAKKGLWLDRLAHHGDRSRGLGSVSKIAASGHYYHRNVGQPRIFASLRKEAPSVESGHHQIEKNHRGTDSRVGHQLDCPVSIGRGLDRVAVQRQ